MQTALRMITAICSTGILIGCASDEKLADARIVPAMKVRHSYESADGYYALGRYHHGARRLDEAEKAYQHALALDPRHMKARNAMAILHAERGEYDQAIALLRELADAAPDAGHLLSNLGYTYFLAGDYEAALFNLERATLIDPMNAGAWGNLGRVLGKLGQADRARTVLAQAQALTLAKMPGRIESARRALSGNEAERTAAEPAPVRLPLAEAKPVANGSVVSGNGPGGEARTEIRQVAASIFEVRQVGAGAPQQRLLPGGDDSHKANDVAERSKRLFAPEGFEVASNGTVHRPISTPDSTTARVRIEVSNGNGINGMARSFRKILESGGMQVVRLTNQDRFDVKATRIEYNEGFEQAARRLAEDLGQRAVLLPLKNSRRSDLLLVLGKDIADTKTIRMQYVNRFKVAGMDPQSVLRLR